MYSREYGLDFTSLRYANIYGERQGNGGEGGVISIFIKKMLAGETPVIYGDGLQTRDFVYVSDTVSANLLALKKLQNHIYNIGTARDISILQIYNLIAKELNFTKKPIFKESKPREVRSIRLDYSKIKKETGWQPRFSLQQGIRNTIGYFKKLG
jgi:UDP-glucose 4-epimerase